MKSLVSILIVNWNSKENLRDCLESLFKIDYPNYEVVVVDNGSSDDSMQMVERYFPTVKVVQSGKNLGFAGGNEFGLRHCRGKYILFLNNDTIVTKSFLTKLVSFIEKDKKLAVIQPTILFHRPGEPLHEKINSVGSFILNTGFLYHLKYGKEFIEKDYEESYEIYTAYGACFLANRDIVNKLGLFDPEYFAYFEETDFCHRVWLSGYKVMIYTKAVIYHKGAKTAQKLPSSFIQYHSFKNRLFTYLKNFELINILKIFIPHLFICEASSLLYLAMRRPGYTVAIQKAIVWNILKIGKLIKERRRVQDEIRKIRDADFIPKLTRKVNIRYYYYLSSGELEKYKE